MEMCVVARTGALVNRIVNDLQGMNIQTLMLDSKTKDDSGIQGVRVATMHRVKGMEFTCMYIPYANSDFLPLRAEIRHAEQDEIPDLMRQEANLLSVAMTRAKRKVLITYRGKPSPFLKAIM